MDATRNESSGALYDVAVIGAGPMGSFVAERMARAGLRVVLFEKDEVPGASGVCAGGLAMDIARSIDLPPEAAERSIRVLRLHTPGRTREWSFPSPVCVTVDRRRFDRLLAERAVAAGAELRTGCRDVRVDPSAGSLTFGPDERQARARVFIYADGPNSIGRTRKDGLRSAAVQIDLEAPANDFPALEFFADARWISFGYGWMFPKRDFVSVGIGRLTTVRGPSLWTLLDRLVEERPELRGRRVLRRQGATIPASLAPVLQRDNWLAIGDAAGTVNPLTGGGYLCGFKSAALAAETCVDAFRGGAPDLRVLAEYPRRLRASRPYRVFRGGDLALRTTLAVHRATGRSIYPFALARFLGFVHFALRLGVRPS